MRRFFSKVAPLDPVANTAKAISVLLLSVAAASPSFAVEIFSNYPTGSTTFPGFWGVFNIPPSPNWNWRQVGMKFTVASGADVELGLAVAPMRLSGCYVPALPGSCQQPPAGTTYSVWLNLLADNNGVPGAFLARSSAAILDTQTVVEETFGFGSGLVLQGGRTYWLHADSPPSAATGEWAWNPLGQLGTGFWVGNFPTYGPLTFNSFSANPTPAIRLLSPVPEPQTAMLIAAGLTFLLGRVRRRHLGQNERDKLGAVAG